MKSALPRPSWRRRPIFLWQIRILFLTALLLLYLHFPSLPRPTTLSAPENPCRTRPTPPPLPKSPPPTLFFLHIPKTAGTLLYRVTLQYANRTNGIACSYTLDGARARPSDYVQAPTPAHFTPDSPAAKVQSAIKDRDPVRKTTLLAQGFCRVMRGHVTFLARHFVDRPVLSVTVVRDPLTRFVSMYEFVVAMVKSRPSVTGWDTWLAESRSLAAEFANSSSIFHRGFVDDAGNWLARQNVGFSFHFYGVLHQLSGITPQFEGVQDPYHFRMANDAEMAEAAKDNLCRMHVLGQQEDMAETWQAFFSAMRPYARWTDEEKRVVGLVNINRTPGRISRNVDDHLSERLRAELERRLAKEIEVVEFAKSIIAYRKWQRENDR